ncbi:FAD-dependent thymidylate synthase [Patescibacteria group bacterium]
MKDVSSVLVVVLATVRYSFTFYMTYTRKEKQLLSSYFTNTNDDIFALVNLPEVIKGTLFSRYSRSAKDLRRLFLDEFVKHKDLRRILAGTKRNKNYLELSKAEDFYERVLIGFGDDSVAELGSAHIAIENISVLATKSIEKHRIGLSPLEKSTRYVYFDQKVNGEYLYYKDKNILNSRFKNDFISANDLLFDTYSKIVHDIQPSLEHIFPGDGTESAYRASIRAKACDLARGLLPLSTKTNMGILGNGRSLEYLLTCMLNDDLSEVKYIANKMLKNLRVLIPTFVKRAKNKYGKATRGYISKRCGSLNSLRKYNIKMIKPVKNYSVKLIDFDRQTENKILSALLYNQSNLEYSKCKILVKKMSSKEKESVFKKALKHRDCRQHKPCREFEEAYVSFEVTADFGVYKDLMRHRMLTQYRKLFTTELGYLIPEEIKIAKLDDVYKKALENANNVYIKLKKRFPTEAQYIVPHAAYNRFYMKMNIREAFHLTELRSIPQGHPSYRKVAQDMAKLIKNKFPLLGKYLFAFVDYNQYDLERLEAFRKLEKRGKEKKVDVFRE